MVSTGLGSISGFGPIISPLLSSSLASDEEEGEVSLRLPVLFCLMGLFSFVFLFIDNKIYLYYLGDLGLATFATLGLALRILNYA